MFIAILQHTPAWVWGLLAVMSTYGWSQTREREMSLVRLSIVPLVLLALSAAGVLSAFGHAPMAVGGWGAGLAASLTIGRHAVAVRGAAWLASRGTVRVPGSWLPMALMLALFTLKYAVGVSLALQPALAHDAAFSGACSLAFGAASGLFLARALALRGVARGVAVPQPA